MSACSVLSGSIHEVLLQRGLSVNLTVVQYVSSSCSGSSVLALRVGLPGPLPLDLQSTRSETIHPSHRAPCSFQAKSVCSPPDSLLLGSRVREFQVRPRCHRRTSSFHSPAGCTLGPGKSLCVCTHGAHALDLRNPFGSLGSLGQTIQGHSSALDNILFILFNLGS